MRSPWQKSQPFWLLCTLCLGWSGILCRVGYGTRVDSDAYGYGWIILVHGSSCSEGDLDWAMRGMLPSKGYQGVGPTVEMPG